MPAEGEADATPARAGESIPPGEFERLRELLFGSELRELATARARIAELEEAQRALPERLPAALEALRGDQATNRVANALSAPVAQALGLAVRENRQPLIDALFPVIGPLIRKSIAEALRNLVADLNGAIEASFTLRGIKWRLEALRGGVPYAQVVLKHRLSYRIDHVFLIERESGLVLWRASAPELAPLDADSIAGMLTALGDFVDDSMGEGQGGSLESARVGEHLVWVVQGPRANLACFIRGVPPAQLHARLQQRLEEVHDHLAIDSDPSHASSWQALLEPTSLLAAADGASVPRRRMVMWPWVLAIVVALAALAVLAISRERWGARVEILREHLKAQPGFVLGSIESRPWRSISVHGLIDPDAQPLKQALPTAGLGKVVPRLVLDGYVSTDDSIVARRAGRLLGPPPGARLTVVDGTLRIEGDAPADWIEMANQRAAWIAGVKRVDLALTPTPDARAVARTELNALALRLQSLRVPFASDAQPTSDAPRVIDEIVAVAERAREVAKSADMSLSLTAIGSHDETGGDKINARILARRAQWLADNLAARGVAGIGTGSASSANQRSAWLQMTIGTPAP